MLKKLFVLFCKTAVLSFTYSAAANCQQSGEEWNTKIGQSTVLVLTQQRRRWSRIIKERMKRRRRRRAKYSISEDKEGGQVALSMPHWGLCGFVRRQQLLLRTRLRAGASVTSKNEGWDGRPSSRNTIPKTLDCSSTTTEETQFHFETISLNLKRRRVWKTSTDDYPNAVCWTVTMCLSVCGWTTAGIFVHQFSAVEKHDSL